MRLKTVLRKKKMKIEFETDTIAELGYTKAVIFACIKANPKGSYAWLYETTGMSLKSLVDNIHALEKWGYIKRVRSFPQGTTRKGKWIDTEILK